MSRGFVWQPSVSVEAYGAGLSVWANFVLNDEPNQGEFNEVDFVPYYTVNLFGLTVTPSFEAYVFPNSNPQSLDYSPTHKLRLALHLSYPIGYFDIFGDGEVEFHPAVAALYLDFGSGFHYRIIGSVSVDTSVLFAVGNDRFNRAYIADVGTKLNLFEYTLAFPWNLWKGLTLKPILQVTTFIAPSLRKAVNNPTQVRGGVEMAYDF